MSAASIVSSRRFRPSMDQSRDVGDPISVTTVKAEQVEAARQIVTAEAVSDADRIILLNALGIDEVAA